MHILNGIDVQITTNYGMKYANEVQKMVEAGEERPVQGLLEQWLREGKMGEREAVMSSTSMFTAGIDTVSWFIPYFFPWVLLISECVRMQVLIESRNINKDGFN